MKESSSNSVTVEAVQAGLQATAAPRSNSLTRLTRAISQRRSLMLTILAVSTVFCGQLVEDLYDSPPLQLLPPTLLIARWTVIGLVFYVFVASAVVERRVHAWLESLRHVVAIDEEKFRSYVDRMRQPTLLVDGTLLLISLLINVVLFVVMGSDLLVNDPVTHQRHFLPPDPIAALLVVAGYSVIGWALLRLVYFTARLAWVLGHLSRETLRINVFDTSDLIPFGNIALAVALAPAGAIILLLVGLGAPTSLVAWSVLVEATGASLLALLLPLRGIHHQMTSTKDAALNALNIRIASLYEDVTTQTSPSAADMAGQSYRAGALIPMRKAAQEMTTWPFRDTVAFGRALIIASAPLIYTTLSELIKVFWITPLAP